MAKQKYVISFVNGSSEPVSLPIGKYTFVSSDIPGYEHEGTTMAEFEVTPSTTAIPLAISANGTLTVQVKDDLGNPITAGEIQLCNTDKSEQFGDPESIVDGKAVFQRLPYTTGGIPFFLAQNGSDEGHIPMDGTQAVNMVGKEQTEDVLNQRKSFPVTFSLTDENYGDIAAYTGDVTVNG